MKWRGRCKRCDRELAGPEPRDYCLEACRDVKRARREDALVTYLLIPVAVVLSIPLLAKRAWLAISQNPADEQEHAD